jgi:3-hydroxybutyryl-CoA dehydrogenase
MSDRSMSVIGCGTMGNGIAHCFALNGFGVYLVDLNQEILDRAHTTIKKNMERQVKKELITGEDMGAALSKIKFTTDLQLVSDSSLVVEAISENEKIKKDLFRKLDFMCNPDCILATNTSSISIT